VLASTQLVLYASLAYCVHRNFSSIAQSDGISFYGVTPATLGVLSIGFISAAGGLVSVGRSLAHQQCARWFVNGIFLEAIGFPLLLLTPYNQGALLNWAHMTVGVTMALTSFALSISLLPGRHVARRLPVVTQFAGGLLAACSLPDWHVHELFQGEVILLVGFGVALFLGLDSPPPPRMRTRAT